MKLASVGVILGLLLAGCQLAGPAVVEPSPSPTASAASPTSSPAPSPSPTTACDERSGRLEETNYPSPLLDGQVELSVFLPPCYGFDESRLPSLYLFHGKPYDQTHWLSLGAVSTLEQGQAAGLWGPAVVIFPNLPEPLFSRSDGGPGSYEQEFIDGVLPFVEANYLVSPEADRRAIAGISRGGIWALEIGLSRPDLFATVGGISPALSVNYPRLAYDPFELVRSAPSGNRLALFTGDTDWARAETERLAATAESAGLQVHLLIQQGSHRDSTWQAALSQILAAVHPALLQ